MMWVCLNDAGMRVWGDVFPDGKVPVTAMEFHEVTLGDGSSKEKVVLVAWAVLSAAQKEAVLDKIVDKQKFPKGAMLTRVQIRNDILKQILSVGMPLRRSYTTGIIAAELRFFI